MTTNATNDLLQRAGFTDRELAQTFDNYVCYDAKQSSVLDTCRAMPKYRWLVLLGECGTGKDHIASAVVRSFVERDMHGKILSGTSQTLMRRYRDRAFHCDNPSEDAAFSRLADTGCLVIRDLGARSISESERGIWLDVLNYRYDEKKTTIFTTNVAPTEFSNVFDLRLTDRVWEMGWPHNGQPFVRCDWLSYRRNQGA